MAKIAELQELYFEKIAPGVLTSGHFALLEEVDAGETVITNLGNKIGHIALDGIKACEVILGQDIDTDKMKVSFIIVQTEPKPIEVPTYPSSPPLPF